MFKQIKQTIPESKRAAQRNISDIDLAALPPFPLHNQSILRDLTVVWEKTALLGDLTLRLPDLVHAQCDNHNVRMSVAEWAIGLCETAPLFQGAHGQQLGLIRQELHIADKVDPKYVCVQPTPMQPTPALACNQHLPSCATNTCPHVQPTSALECNQHLRAHAASTNAFLHFF